MTRNGWLPPVLLVLLIVGFTLEASSPLIPAAGATSPPVHRTFWLRAHYLFGWNDTKPGPFVPSVSGDQISVMLIGTDSFSHSFFLDFNNNGIVDSNETATSSPDFFSTTTYFNYTFTPAVGQNIPAAGNWTYRCRYHPSNMFGTFQVLPEQFPVSISSTSTVDTSTVTTTGSLTIDTRTLTVTGTVTATATDTTTGQTTFTKTYVLPSLQLRPVAGSTAVRVRFLVNVAVLPQALSSDITIQLQGLTSTSSILLSRQVDINGNGKVDSFDLAILLAVFNSKLGDGKYRADADINANGTINAFDLAILLAYFTSPSFR